MLARYSSSCFCFSSIMVLAPAASSSSRNAGRASAGSIEPHAKAFSYLPFTFRTAVTSLSTLALSQVKPMAGETMAESFQAAVSSQIVGESPSHT